MKSLWHKFGVFSLLTASLVVITLLLKAWINIYPEPNVLKEALYHIYYIPILFAAVFLGETAGAVIAVLAIVATGYLTFGFHKPELLVIWPVLLRGSFFITTAYVATRIADRLRSDTRAMQSLLDISHSVTSSLDLDETLQAITVKAVELTSADACAIRLLCENGDMLLDAKTWGLSERYLLYGPLLTRDSPYIQNLLNGEEIVLRDVRKHDLPNLDEILREGIRSIYSLPLSTRDGVIGQLSLYRKRSSGIARRDLRVARTFAEQAAIALQNAKLYDSIRSNYLDTVRALTQAIEANDSMTLGHSERVSRIAVSIAQALGLSHTEVEQLEFGSMLHDIGKIGFNEQTLAKSGRLSLDEQMLMEMHPLIGKSIIEPVEFLRACIPIVLYHHERWDGLGYPEGLAGADIPLLARIVAIANGYDHLAHRASGVVTPMDTALLELRSQAGTLYDPNLIDVLEMTLLEERLEEVSAMEEPVADAETA